MPAAPSSPLVSHRRWPWMVTSRGATSWKSASNVVFVEGTITPIRLRSAIAHRLPAYSLVHRKLRSKKPSHINSNRSSRRRRRAHRRDVCADDPPANAGEAHPRLALTADHVLATHLELEVHGGQVAAEREDFETDPLLLGARPRRARHAVRVDLRKAIAMLVERVANGVRAVPERRVQHLDVLVDQRLLVALEQRAHLRHDLGDVDGHVHYRAASSALATATSAASLPWPPTIDNPTGRPSTLAPGTLTCGTPVSPPCAASPRMRARTGSSAASGWPLRGAGHGVVGLETSVTGGHSDANRARASLRTSAAHSRSLSGISAARARFAATLNCTSGFAA